MSPAEKAKSHLDGAGEAGSAIAGFSIKRPVTITMAFVSLVVLGVISTTRIPLVMMPDVTFPFLFVAAPYPNATPAQIQQSITRPLEEVIATIPGVKRMSSTSSSDQAQIQVFFDWGADSEMIRAEVREKVDQIRNDLPDDLRQVYVRNFGSSDIPILEATISSKRDLRTSYDFLDVRIKKPLERIPGVAEVELWGVQRRQLDIYLRLDDVKRYSVDIASLFRRLNEANLNLSLGRVEDGRQRFGVVSRGALDSTEAIARFPVNERGLTLGDIADIVFDNPNVNSGQHLNGQYGVGFSVRKASNANTVETLAEVRQTLAALEDDPAFAGIETHVWHDAGREITKSLGSLLESGTVGAVLAVFTLMIFLRKAAASLVIGLAIPFSILIALGFLYFTGTSLNLLSMMGLMLSTGMLVDNAVVVMESIYQKLERGVDRETAAREGAGEVTTAVIAATLTSIIIFVPLVFGERTEMTVLLGQAGRSIIFALLCSLFISLTLIPMAMARFLRVDATKRSPFERWFTRTLDAPFRFAGRLLFGRTGPAERDAEGDGPVVRGYLRLVDWPLRHRFLTGFVLAPALVAGAIYLLQEKIPDNSPDAQEMGALRINYKFSENFHYAKIEQDYVDPVEDFLAENKGRFHIKNYMSRYANNSAWTRIYFETEDVGLSEMQELRETIQEELPVIPGAEIRTGRQEGAQNNSWLSASLHGDDPYVLSEIATTLRDRLLALEDFSEVSAGDDEGREEVQIRLHRELARKYGVSPESVSGVLGIAVRASRLRGYRTPEGEVEMWLQLHPDDLADMNDLASITVGEGRDGEPIALRQVADLSVERVSGRIRREDRRTFTDLYGMYTGPQQEEGRREFARVMDSYAYPEGYGWSFGFWTQQQQAEDRDMKFNVLLALFMVYFVMASLFESLLHPFAIMISLPFALVGVAGFLLLTGTPFNMMATIGTIVLVGIVVNNGIVLLDHINNLRRRGYSRPQAIRAGCRERLRPIVMTAATTVVGLIPLAFGETSIGNMRYFPMARTVMGGLVASTALTLIVLPTYYSLLDDFGRYLRRLWFASDPRRSPAERGSGPEPVAGD